MVAIPINVISFKASMFSIAGSVIKISKEKLFIIPIKGCCS